MSRGVGLRWWLTRSGTRQPHPNPSTVEIESMIQRLRMELAEQWEVMHDGRAKAETNVAQSQIWH